MRENLNGRTYGDGMILVWVSPEHFRRYNFRSTSKTSSVSGGRSMGYTFA